MSFGYCRFQVPIPPSANRLWRRSGNRIHRSRAYVAWLEECDLATRAMGRRVAFTGPVVVDVQITAGKGFPRSRDLDNVLKPVLDLLRHMGVIPDDRVTEVEQVVARYVPGKRGAAATCVVSVACLGEGG